MIDYRRLTDNELIKRYREGDQWAFEEITDRYKETVKFHARLFFLTGGDGEDLLQEGMIGLFEAANTYKEDRNASFATFADKCIRSRIIKAVGSDNKKSNLPLNTSLPIYMGNESDEQNYGCVNVSLESDRGEGNPESIVLEKEIHRIQLERISGELSDFENTIFMLYLSGKSLSGISEAAGVTYKSVDNAISRIKSKVRAIKDELLQM